MWTCVHFEVLSGKSTRSIGMFQSYRPYCSAMNTPDASVHRRSALRAGAAAAVALTAANCAR